MVDGGWWLISVSTISLGFKGLTSQHKSFTAIHKPLDPVQTSYRLSWTCQQRCFRLHATRGDKSKHEHTACVRDSETRHWSRGDSSSEAVKEQCPVVVPCLPLAMPEAGTLFLWLSSEILPSFPSLLCPFPKTEMNFLLTFQAVKFNFALQC